jgi:protein-L-isoaspartate(D-aspartate) O-methyltransferase
LPPSKITRHSQTGYAAEFFAAASFVPCVGACDDAASQALTIALESGNQHQVKSLRRHTRPDETAWCIGTEWWLSLAETID